MRYIIRRLVFYTITAWAAITMNFAIPRLMPGNPVQSLMSRFGGQLTPHAEHALLVLFGLNRTSIWGQYTDYWGQLFHGNLGLSSAYFPTPVVDIIEQSLPWTLVLVGTCTVLSFLIGTSLGMVVGWRRGSRWLEPLLPVTTFLSSMPYFWFALIVVFVFAQKLHWFPQSGGYSPLNPIGFTFGFIASALYHSLLPAFTIVVSSMAGWILAMRNMMVTTLGEDYVLMAEAEGLPASQVMVTFAARNAVLPSMASFAMSLGFIVAGAILVETVFDYPGIGYVLLQAVTNADYPLMQGIFLIITLSVLVANLLADLAYVALDPRVRST